MRRSRSSRRTGSSHKVSVLQVGRERSNQAIVALAVRPAPSGVTRSVFLSIANLDIEPARRQLEIWADGVLIEAKDLEQLEPQTRTEVVIDDIPRGATVIEARLTAGGERRRRTTQLAVDDRAWAIVPPDRRAGRPDRRRGRPVPRERAARSCRTSSCSRRQAGRVPGQGDAHRRVALGPDRVRGHPAEARAAASAVLLIAPPATSDARRGRPAR